MVLLKGLDPPDHPARGFVFFTNFESDKGQELLGSGKGALCFHWKSLRRQVRVRGHAVPVPDAEADTYFATRARGSRLGPGPPSNRARWRAALPWKKPSAMVTARYPLGEIPRPPTAGPASASRPWIWSSGMTALSGCMSA